MGRSSERTKLQALATSPEALIRVLLGTDVELLQSYRGTDLWVPTGDTLTPDSVLRWLTPFDGGVVGVIDLWALRRGLMSEIGPEGANGGALDTASGDREERGSDRLVKTTTALVEAARDFLESLPYSGSEIPVLVDHEWVEAELHAALIEEMILQLPPIQRSSALGPADARMRELWSPDSSEGKLSGGAPETTRRYVRACQRAQVPNATIAASIAALESLNPHAHTFSSTRSRASPSAEWASESIRERFDTIRVVWGGTDDHEIPTVEREGFRAPRIPVKLEPKDLTVEGRRRRVNDRFRALEPGEVRGLKVSGPFVFDDQGELDMELSGFSTHATFPEEEEEVPCSESPPDNLDPTDD